MTSTTEQSEYWGGFIVQRVNPNIKAEMRDNGYVTFRPSLKVETTSETIRNHIVSRFDGKVTEVDIPKYKPNSQPLFVWKVTEAGQILTFTTEILSSLPYRQDVYQAMVDFVDYRILEGDNSDPFTRMSEEWGLYQEFQKTKKRPLLERLRLPPTATLAGMVDAKSSIYLTEDQILMFDLSCRHFGLLLSFQDQYNGSDPFLKGNNRATDRIPFYTCRTFADNAARALKDLLPHLHLLKDRAETAIEFERKRTPLHRKYSLRDQRQFLYKEYQQKLEQTG